MYSLYKYGSNRNTPFFCENKSFDAVFIWLSRIRLMSIGSTAIRIEIEFSYSSEAKLI